MLNASSLRSPKYHLPKAKGLAVVTLAGRDIYLGKYGSAASKNEYRPLVAEYLQSGDACPLDRQKDARKMHQKPRKNLDKRGAVG